MPPRMRSAGVKCVGGEGREQNASPSYRAGLSEKGKIGTAFRNTLGGECDRVGKGLEVGRNACAA